MTNLEEVDPADEGRVYRDKPFHSRLLVAVAGSAMHFLMAFVLLWVLLTFVGIPNSNQVQIQGLHAVGDQASPAGAGGIRPGDVVVSVDGKAIGGDVDAFTSAIQRHPDQPVTIVVDRDGSRRTLTVTPANGRTEHEKGAVPPRRHRALRAHRGQPRIAGADPVARCAPSPPPGRELGSVAWASVTGIGHLFSPSGDRRSGSARSPAPRRPARPRPTAPGPSRSSASARRRPMPCTPGSATSCTS